MNSKEHKTEASPKVENYGYYKDLTSDGWGLNLGLTFDLGGGYKYPMYNEAQYLVQEAQGSLKLGGKSYVSLELGYAKLHIFLDVVGA